MSHAVYEASDYVKAEAFLRQAGHPDQADQAYIAHQDWERENLWTGLRKVGGWLQMLYVGYGRQPLNALMIGGLIVVLAWGVLVAWLKWGHGAMVQRTPPAAGAHAAAFKWFPDGLWYALDVFAPVINLKIQDEWRPNHRAVEFVEKLLTLAGWVIVPLGVAAITGLVK